MKLEFEDRVSSFPLPAPSQPLSAQSNPLPQGKSKMGNFQGERSPATFPGAGVGIERTSAREILFRVSKGFLAGMETSGKEK